MLGLGLNLEIACEVSVCVPFSAIDDQGMVNLDKASELLRKEIVWGQGGGR